MDISSTINSEAIMAALDSQILVIDNLGIVKFSNRKSVSHFGSLEASSQNVQGSNYLEYCHKVKKNGNENAGAIHDGLRDLIEGLVVKFEWEYPLNAEGAPSWCSIEGKPLAGDSDLFLIQHKNITKEKKNRNEASKFAAQLKHSAAENLSIDELLQEQSKLLKASINLAKLGTWQFDLLKDRVYLDEIARTIFGLSIRDKILNFDEFIQHFGTEDKRRLIAQFESTIISGKEWNGIFKVKSDTNETKWISTEAQSILNEQGSIIKIICVSQDITAQEELKQQLRTSEEKSQILFDYSPILIWEENFSEIKSNIERLKREGIIDFKKYFNENQNEVKRLAETVEFMQMNKTSLEFYEVKSKEELISNLADWFVDDSWELFTNELIALAEGNLEFEGEVEILAPSGVRKKLFLKLKVPPQYKDTLEVVLVSFIDITLLKEKEKLLLEKEQKILEYSLLLEQKVQERTHELTLSESRLKVAQKIAKIGYWDLDLKTKQVGCSKEFYSIYEVPVGSFATLADVMESFHPDDKFLGEKIIKDLENQKIPQPFNFRIITPGGEIKHIYSSIRPPVKNKNGIFDQLVGINQDVTSLKKFESLQEQVEGVLQGQESERERLAGELHDSINPLLSLASLNVESLIENESFRDEKHSSKLTNTISILQEAIEGIREISRNLSPAVLKNFGLAKGLEQLVNQVRGMGKMNINLHIHDMKDRIEFKIELHLFRITQELINNILKHSKATEVDVQLIKHVDTLILMVSDNGIGFDFKEKTLKYDGYGMKSIISRVESLDGTIDIDSAFDRGTTTIIEIPI